MIQVVPSIIPEDFNQLKEEMALVRHLVKRVQIDVGNGSYAPTVTWPYAKDTDSIFQGIIDQEEGMPFWEDLDFEVDLLLSESENYIDDWIQAGAVGFVVHIESTDAHADIYQQLKEAEVEIGWGTIPSTPVEDLFNLIEDIGSPDFVQVMGNDKIGYHGVELDEEAVEKIRAIRNEYPELPIAIDIGINRDTAHLLVEAGVTKMAPHSAVYGAEDMEGAIRFFETLEA